MFVISRKRKYFFKWKALDIMVVLILKYSEEKHPLNSLLFHTYLLITHYVPK